MIKTRLKTAPSVKAVTLSELKTHLGVTDTSRDTLLTTYLDASISHVEGGSGRAMITQTWEILCDSWHEAGELLPFGKLQSVTSIKYLDDDGVENTLPTDEYKVAGIGTDDGQIIFLDGFSCPSLYEAEPITIEFVCGYGATLTDDAAQLKAAILLNAEDMYWQTSDNEKAVESLIRSKKISWGHI